MLKYIFSGIIDEYVFMASAIEWFVKGLRKAKCYPFFNLLPPGRDAGILAGKLLEIPDLEKKSAFIAICSRMAELLFKLMQLDSHTSQQRETIFASIHLLVIDKENCEHWKRFVLDCGLDINIEANNLLFPHLLDSMSQESLKFRNNLLTEECKVITYESIKLSRDEEETLRFMAGYIPYSLLKKYEKSSSASSKAIKNILKSWKKEEDMQEESFMHYTEKWINEINIGGLFQVNYEFFIFIRRVENVARTILNNPDGDVLQSGYKSSFNGKV